ncbi:hypothetical protein [Mariniflexile sp. AS56]|uniref:hypothetical protein n=1 Tax=Mariniflexile sp. AS56 TaxID=3063957 RepID=UPI0026F0D19B|nr:hypothetical protein [Mariniflexile sp. AS56]MDO7170944.1 hypothetical protein [Mariniflexile sp. AS56]
MKFIKALILVLLVSVSGCSSSETVIKDGKVYTIKGDKILNNGVDISKTITSEEKNAIESVLKQRQAAKKAADEKAEALEAKQEELERVQEKAEAEQKVLEKQQEALQDKLEAKENARADFLKANEKLKKAKDEYKELHEKGELSPRDEEKWAEKLKELQTEKDKTEQLFNKL